MQDIFNIYVDRLLSGHTEKISETISPNFLDVHEDDLSFFDPIMWQGEAYIADRDLVLNLAVTTCATLPCSICNEPVKVMIKNIRFYNITQLKDIKSGILNYKNILREAILLEVPQFAECHEGKCPQRKILNKYLKESHEGENYYCPFADLE